MTGSHNPPLRRRRPGFALLTVLWVVVALGVTLFALGQQVSRLLDRLDARREAVAARWAVRGCLAAARARLDSAIASSVMATRARVWSGADSELVALPGTPLDGCDITLRTDGRIVITRAAAGELESLPGMTPEAVMRLGQLQEALRAGSVLVRAADGPQAALMSIEPLLSPPARATLDAHVPALLRAITAEPDGWVLRGRAKGPSGIARVNIEARVVRSGNGTAVTRWVEW